MKTKELVIKKIKTIINKYGSLMSGEVTPEGDVFYASIGENITALINEYLSDKVIIYVYDCRSANEIDDFAVPYEDLDVDTLKEILTNLKNYESRE